MKFLFFVFVLSSPLMLLAEEITFNQHIGPLVYQKCATCHHPGAAGPFSLLSYSEVSKKARTIRRAVESQYMPPWHPVDAGVEFAHNRSLSAAEVAMFGAWIEGGKLEGTGPAPAAPSFADGWSLGEPDLVVSMKEAFPVPAEGPDIYRNFALKLDLPDDKWVTAIELRPSARSAVHHSLFFLDDTGTALEMDGKDGKPGFRGMAFRRTGRLGGYVPGSTTQFLPEGLAMALPKGSDLVLSTHFHPTGKEELEMSTVGLYFADGPPSRTLANIQVPPAFGRGLGIDVPAGESNYRRSDSFVLPVGVDAFAVGGHAHYICKEMKMTAVSPDGEETILLQIDNWDLNWQDRYFFKQPIHLVAGTEIRTDLVYDNSADNPDNPFDPPQRIRWGHESTDEMGSITLMVAPSENVDEAKLARASRMKQVEVLGAVAREMREGSGSAMVKRIGQLDTNRNGLIEKAEIPERFRARVLQNFDGNKDDAIDRKELGALLESIRNGLVNAGGQE
tara:strand:- start:4969 stop:6483 length:1515 start_codon:yes stop_codon:yes gene_type:complete